MRSYQQLPCSVITSETSYIPLTMKNNILGHSCEDNLVSGTSGVLIGSS